ncbi:uncharacterized protein LOC132712676 [Ruditapes philippinarum]|uniref:uncharacterized protein LOC132712676 n=1 Tax=Ruditapes philippinarum TaxID=129788 RepID=UPI00295A5C64|nr:uncharacterized protein LOC132712676 [Ruditapes philippinarum]
MDNPCSYESVKRVIKEIRKTSGVTEDNLKTWCIMGCDGLPYTLGSRLIEKNKDMQNILLIPGHGHIEMNVVKAAFKLLWEPILQDLSKECGFKSPRAQVAAQSCTDHHKSYMLLEIMFESALQEIMTTFIINSVQNSITPNIATFFDYIKSSKDKNYRFMCDAIINFIFPIFLYRAGVRRNNFGYISAAKAKFFKLFFSGGMKNYQQLIMKDIKTYILAPPEVKHFLQKTQSFTVSGHPSKGEGGDFILEAINKKIQRWLPPGIPLEKHWRQVCRTAHILDKIRENTLQQCTITEDRSSYVYKRDISNEIEKYRMRLRKIGYLNNKQTLSSRHTSVNGEILDHELYLFENQINVNIEAFLNCPENPQITPVFTTELQRTTFHSIERKTKKQLNDIIERDLKEIEENGNMEDAYVFKNKWIKVKSRPKQEMLQFYKEMVASIESSKADSNYISDGIKLLL